MTPQTGGTSTAVRAHEELFAYWSSLKRRGRLPGRKHINPGDFKRHLPSVCLINVLRGEEGVIDYRVRLAGTGLYGVYGQEITGKTLEEAYGPAAPYWRAELDKVVTARSPRRGCSPCRGEGSDTCRWCGCGCRWPTTAGRST
jgi:hypothetical protein